MQELWTGQTLFYSMTSEYTNYVKIDIMMDRDIDKAVMKLALDTAIKRYPYYKVRMARKGEEIVLLDNDAPLLIYDDVDAPTMEPEKNNDYLFKFSVSKAVLSFCVCHAATDGRGMMKVLKTLLHYYNLYSTGFDPGIPGANICGPEMYDEIKEEEEDPLKNADLGEIQMSAPKEQPSPFRLPVKKDTSGKKHVFTFETEADSFMKYSHEIDGSPNAILAMFLARAIHRLHPDADNIVGGVAIDEHAALGCKNAHDCLVNLILIPYSRKMYEMSVTSCATCYRGIIILQSDTDYVRKKLAMTQQFCRYLKNLKTFEEKCQVSSGAVMRGSSMATYTVSYVGKLDFGRINSHIQYIHPVVDTEGFPLAVEIMSFGNKFMITVTQNFEDDMYVNELINELENEGIKCSKRTYEVSPYVHGPVPSECHPE